MFPGWFLSFIGTPFCWLRDEEKERLHTVGQKRRDKTPFLPLSYSPRFAIAVDQ